MAPSSVAHAPAILMFFFNPRRPVGRGGVKGGRVDGTHTLPVGMAKAPRNPSDGERVGGTTGEQAELGNYVV